MYNILMKTVTFTEFRKNASRIMDLVEKGETVRVLRHGRAIARIVPAAAGTARPSWKRSGLRLVVAGGSLSKAVLEERESSR
jgi:prevent-host-death family protein